MAVKLGSWETQKDLEKYISSWPVAAELEVTHSSELLKEEERNIRESRGPLLSIWENFWNVPQSQPPSGHYDFILCPHPRMSSSHSDPSSKLPGAHFSLPGGARDLWAQRFPLMVNLWRIWSLRITSGAYYKWILMKLEILLFCGKCLQIFHQMVSWVLQCSEMWMHMHFAFQNEFDIRCT